MSDDNNNTNDSSSSNQKRKVEDVGDYSNILKPKQKKKSSAVVSAASCPYLDTIERSMLDFDFEPSCSVSLERGPQNIYGCLICGKYFRGRGMKTPAYIHSVDVGHFVFIHLYNGKFYCLPDNYEIDTEEDKSSLKDISEALHPTYTIQQINELDTNKTLCRDLFGRRYLPGFVGLNNLNKTDYINATIQALAHVQPLRDYFLKQQRQQHQQQTATTVSPTTTSYTTNNSTYRMLAQNVTQCFGELIRKMWSDKRFKSHVDPHMLIQAITVASRKKYRVGYQAEVGEFMAWFLHQLHIGIGGEIIPSKQKKQKNKKDNTNEYHTTIIHEIFQGKVQVTTRQKKKKKKKSDLDDDEDDRGGSDHDDEDTEQQQQQQQEQRTENDNDVQETTKICNFLQLTLDIAEKPLFRDDDGGLVIPQEPLVTVLKKFDGVTFNDVMNSSRSSVPGGGMSVQRCRYRLLELPKYLILHLARFKRNHYSTNIGNNGKEKNPTIVAFPVRNLDLSKYVFKEENHKKKKKKKEKKKSTIKKIPTEDEVKYMSIKELKQFLIDHKIDRQHIDFNNIVEKKELVDKTMQWIALQKLKEDNGDMDNEAGAGDCIVSDTIMYKYDLVANITHDSPADVSRTSEKGLKHDPLQEGSYKCHVQHLATNQWYEIQDLHVTETMPQLIGLSESYVLIFQRKEPENK